MNYINSASLGWLTAITTIPITHLQMASHNTLYNWTSDRQTKKTVPSALLLTDLRKLSFDQEQHQWSLKTWMSWKIISLCVFLDQNCMLGKYEIIWIFFQNRIRGCLLLLQVYTQLQIYMGFRTRFFLSSWYYRKLCIPSSENVYKMRFLNNFQKFMEDISPLHYP